MKTRFLKQRSRHRRKRFMAGWTKISGNWTGCKNSRRRLISRSSADFTEREEHIFYIHGINPLKMHSCLLYHYFLIFAISLLVVSFDRMDFTTNVTGVLATLNNVGPGLSAVSPSGNFSAFSPLSKLVFIADMLLGRLEIFPFLVLFTSLFRRK